MIFFLPNDINVPNVYHQFAIIVSFSFLACLIVQISLGRMLKVMAKTKWFVMLSAIAILMMYGWIVFLMYVPAASMYYFTTMQKLVAFLASIGVEWDTGLDIFLIPAVVNTVVTYFLIKKLVHPNSQKFWRTFFQSALITIGSFVAIFMVGFITALMFYPFNGGL